MFANILNFQLNIEKNIVYVLNIEKNIVYVYVRENVNKHNINSTFHFNPSSGYQYVPIHSRVAIIGVWDTVNTLKCRQTWCNAD